MKMLQQGFAKKSIWDFAWRAVENNIKHPMQSIAHKNLFAATFTQNLNNFCRLKNNILFRLQLVPQTPLIIFGI